MANFISDGYLTFDAGQNEGLLADRIRQNQTVRNINLTLKDNALKKRPSFVEQELCFNFSGRIGSGYADYLDIFRKGKVQLFGFYPTDTGTYLVLVISGVIFIIDPRDNVVSIVEVEGEFPRANQYRSRLNWSHAGKFFVIFDWPNQPIILDGFTARRADEDVPEIPLSFIGTFVQNRLFIGNTGIEFGASDPVQRDNPDAPLTFFETIATPTNPNPPFANQFFSLDYIYDLENITAMGYLQQQDSSTGYGPLFISTEKSIHVAPVNQPRDNWTQSQFLSVVIYNYGVVGPRAFTNVGSDLIYKGFDGQIYSLNTGRQNQRTWANTDISREITKSLDTCNRELLEFSAMGYHNNRVFTTLKPFATKAINLFGDNTVDYVNQGLGVIELENASGLTSESNPVWAGIWTGFYPIDMLEINFEFYFIGKNSGNKYNSLVKLEEAGTRDFFSNQSRQVRSRVITKEFVFKDIFADKEARSLKLNFSGVEGDFYAKIFVRRNVSDKWVEWGNIRNNRKPYKLCREYGLSKVLGKTTDKTCEGIRSSFNKIQLRVDLQGDRFTLENLKIRADIKPETDNVSKCNEVSFESKDFGDKSDYQL